MEENPLAAPPGPALILAEAPDPGAGGEVEAELPRGPGQGAWLGQGLAFDWQRIISLGGAGLVDAAGRWGQQGELRGGAFPMQQRRELPQPQVRARVGPLAL